MNLYLLVILFIYLFISETSNILIQKSEIQSAPKRTQSQSERSSTVFTKCDTEIETEVLINLQ